MTNFDKIPNKMPSEEAKMKNKIEELEDFYTPVPVEEIVPGIDFTKFIPEKELKILKKERKIGRPQVTENSFLNVFSLKFRQQFSQFKNNEEVREAVKIFQDQIIVDLGAGENGNGYRLAQRMGAKAYIGIEPYRNLQEDISNKKNPSTVKKNLELMCKEKLEEEANKGFSFTQEWIDDEIDYYTNKIRFSLSDQDMLAFLKALPDKSVSVMAGGIDENILRDEKLSAVSDEIKRVLHPNGAFLSVGSDLIPNELEKIYPIDKKGGHFLFNSSSSGVKIYKSVDPK